MGQNLPDVTVGTSLANVLAEQPFVLVHLLRALPSSNDPQTWDYVTFDGYRPAQSRVLLVNDARPSGVQVRVEAGFVLADGAPPPVAFGVVLAGYGVLVGYITDDQDRLLVLSPRFLTFTIYAIIESWGGAS